MPDQQSEAATPTVRIPPSERLKITMSWVVVVILTGFAVYALKKLTTVHETGGEYWQNMINEQFPVIVALPMAGLGALFITLILRISTGSLEFEVAGLKFKGGAAPIVFWVVCFLSIVISIRLLWQT